MLKQTERKFGLSQETINQICGIFEKYASVEKVVIYGSRAIGNYHNGSDIDLAFIGSISESDWTNIYFELDDLLTPYSFDLSLLATNENLALVDHIQRVGKVFYIKKV